VTALVLVGLMGAGKSVVGGLVAGELGWEMVDVDVAITARTGSTVRELWEAGGEAAYRLLESEVVLDALAAGVPAVIAAPGGVVLNPAVRTALGGAFVVWLRAAPDVLAGRVRPGDHRPLLGDDPLAVLTFMAVDRSELYEAVADAIIDTDALDPGTVADRVLTLVRDRSPRHQP
jgi:shikimate kinase